MTRASRASLTFGMFLIAKRCRLDGILANDKMKAEFEKITQQAGLVGNAERSYLYDDQGRIVERHMRMGRIREDFMRTLNDHGDISESTIETSGFPRDLNGQPQRIRSVCSYEYDEHGNWTSRNETAEVGENTTTYKQVRQLTYYH